jgi:radical SAM protein with 4Fe4S-binding SPASM domain
MTQLPSYVQIEPVGQCNLRCQMCPIQFRKDGPPYGPPAFMEWDTFTRIIDGFTSLEHLHLQGLGEPMMHPRFFDMVRYAAERGIQVTTNSNLTLLNERRAEACVISGLDILHVSIDGASPETYERIRARAHYERVVRNMERLLEARDKLGGARPHIHLVMVIMRQNLHELPELVRLAAGWSVEEMFVQNLSHDFGEASLPAEYRPMRDFVQQESLAGEDPERIERYFRKARALAGELGLKLRLPRTQPRRYPPGTPGRQRCDWPWTGAYISYEGYAMPCCMVSTPDRANLGNVRQTPAPELWQGAAYQGFRDRLDSPEPPEVCRSCSLYWGMF